MIKAIAPDESPPRKQHGADPKMTFQSESRSRIIWLICLAGMAFVLLTALRSLPQISALLLEADGDDQMRLVEVRDWLAGQGWFDTHQYRLLPPEGISMHWSRYVDAGIAAILLAASTVLPTGQAELAAVILWPSVLACLMVLVIAHGTQRLFGNAAALGALAVFLSWGKLGGEFVPPRIDHHNVQILCSTAAFYLSLIPGRSRLLGALAGVMTAVALAVGLEMLPFLAVIWSAVALRFAFAQPKTEDWLLGFGLAITLTAPVLFVGQTPPAEWLINHCDELGPPILALGAIGVAATMLPVLAARFLKGPVARIIAMAGISALGLWLAAPLLGTCVAGPYSDVPAAVREIIEKNITEALSARTLLAMNPMLLGRVLLPPLVICILALAVSWRLRRSLTTVQVTALVQSFSVVAVGLAFASLQIRAANIMTPAIPLLAGLLVHAFTLIPRNSLRRVPAAIGLVLSLPTVIEYEANALALPFMPQLAAKPTMTAAETPDRPVSRLHCRTAEDMAVIARLPKSLIFSTVNLGPAILAYTPHSATSAPYHRSPMAYWNGIGAFETTETLRKALATSGADYLVLCDGSFLERSNPLMKALLAGKLPAWLTDVTTAGQPVRVFQVEKAALTAVGDAP
jgi:hypothetical protein